MREAFKEKTSKVLKNIQFWLNPDLDGKVNLLTPRAIITPRRSVNAIQYILDIMKFD